MRNSARMGAMTKLLDKGIEAVRSLPKNRQDIAGEMLLTIAKQEAAPRYQPTPEQVEGIKEGLAQAERGELATDEEMDALYKKCGL